MNSTYRLGNALMAAASSGYGSKGKPRPNFTASSADLKRSRRRMARDSRRRNR